jgi:hypothetical protein
VALDGSNISFRLRRGYAKKSIKGEKLPTQNPEDPLLIKSFFSISPERFQVLSRCKSEKF